MNNFCVILTQGSRLLVKVYSPGPRNPFLRLWYRATDFSPWLFILSQDKFWYIWALILSIAHFTAPYSLNYLPVPYKKEYDCVFHSKIGVEKLKFRPTVLIYFKSEILAVYVTQWTFFTQWTNFTGEGWVNISRVNSAGRSKEIFAISFLPPCLNKWPKCLAYCVLYGHRWKGEEGRRPPTFLTQMLRAPVAVKNGPLFAC